MRLPELKSIRSMRKQIGINQADLARASGVSQSLIARIESGSVDPSYSKAKKIFLSLENIGHGKSPTASDIMNRRVISIASRASVKEAASTMKRKNISQLPVIDGDVSVGFISEKDIIEKVASGANIDNLALVPVKELMEESFPQVDEKTSISVISILLEYHPAVIVSEHGKIKGIITKADLLKLV
jgi:predicted transcriptional regulator